MIKLPLSYDSFAASTSFPRQEIIDPPDDWSILKTRLDTVYLYDAHGGIQPIEMAKNKTQCLPDPRYPRPPDISAVTYFSDGNTLKATMWLTSPFFEPPSNAGAWLTTDFKQVPWYKILYVMSMHIHSVYDTEGQDYSVGLFWDNRRKTWTRSLEEEGPTADTKILNETRNFTGFYSKNQSYIDLTLDLNSVSSPNQYDLLFYAVDLFVQNGTLCRMVDISNGVSVPPPEFIITTSPSSVLLRPGEEKNIELKVTSTTGVKSQIFLSTTQTNDVKLNFTPNRTSIPPYGFITSLIHVNASKSAKPNPYTLPIFVNISIPTEAKTRLSSITGEVISNTTGASIAKSSDMTITVLPPFTSAEKVMNVYNTWILPMSGIWTFLSVVIGSVTALIIKIYPKKIKRQKNLISVG